MLCSRMCVCDSYSFEYSQVVRCIRKRKQNWLHRYIISCWDLAMLVTMLVKSKVYLSMCCRCVTIEGDANWFRFISILIDNSQRLCQQMLMRSKLTVIYFSHSSFISLNLKTSLNDFLSIIQIILYRVEWVLFFIQIPLNSVFSNRHVSLDFPTSRSETVRRYAVNISIFGYDIYRVYH